jgi:hypothetical protein
MDRHWVVSQSRKNACWIRFTDCEKSIARGRSNSKNTPSRASHVYRFFWFLPKNDSKESAAGVSFNMEDAGIALVVVCTLS